MQSQQMESKHKTVIRSLLDLQWTNTIKKEAGNPTRFMCHVSVTNYEICKTQHIRCLCVRAGRSKQIVKPPVFYHTHKRTRFSNHIMYKRYLLNNRYLINLVDNDVILDKRFHKHPWFISIAFFVLGHWFVVWNETCCLLSNKLYTNQYWSVSTSRLSRYSR